jgi:putative toxin-antitoxin system antitoxin component (TIGR02293 family)
VYHRRLHTLLGIPEVATALQAHEFIAAGFPAVRLAELCEQGNIPESVCDWIVRPRRLKALLDREQRLTVEESEKAFRAVHITLMAEAFFGESAPAAKRWLSRPMSAFDGRTSYAMIETTPGMHLVEERIIQGIEGFVF